ncbi:GNAT family N-acetyltransferase [Planococcus sp. CP5-4]|uniref:GNAT family N-acetyltransferase n=1 Tax=unclassified Planococcus (in: firmicutes) TaxID=2662419 RepID=UPI0027E40680|nr:GNAT family N-acetyltransferase [Planococcus sp. CP5-4]
MIRRAKLSDARGIAKVHVDSWITTYRNIVPDEYLDGLKYEEREKQWERNLQHATAFVAENKTGEVIGFADGGKERSSDYPDIGGEVYAIYILKAYQGQGVGKLLMQAISKELLDRDIQSMIVWVLKENQSSGFYENLGGKVIDEKYITIAGKQIPELAYEWADINVIAKQN